LGYSLAMQIAIFPIPNIVAYPGQVIPLHIFEPRYRQMIQDCLEHDRLLGVCHVKKLLKKAPKTKALNKDLDVYEPTSILSFGKVKLIETLDDGRMLIEVSMKKRGEISKLLQEAPYYLAEVQELKDEANSDPVKEVMLRAELSARFEIAWKASQKGTPPFDALQISFNELSFAILSHLWIDPVFAQTLLEERNPLRRASILLDVLRSMDKPI